MPHIWSQFGPIIWGPNLLSWLLQFGGKTKQPTQYFYIRKTINQCSVKMSGLIQNDVDIVRAYLQALLQ
jgi:hypothetical protein